MGYRLFSPFYEELLPLFYKFTFLSKYIDQIVADKILYKICVEEKYFEGEKLRFKVSEIVYLFIAVSRGGRRVCVLKLSVALPELTCVTL